MRQISTVEQLLRQDRTEEDLQDLMRMQRQRTQFYINGRTTIMLPKHFEAMRKEILEHAGIDMDAFFMRAFVNQFPEVRIEVIENGADDTVTRDTILGCLANFLVGTEFKDDPQLKELMRQQYVTLHAEHAAEQARRRAAHASKY